MWTLNIVYYTYIFLFTVALNYLKLNGPDVDVDTKFKKRAMNK